MHPRDHALRLLTRRHFLGRLGLGSIALAQLLRGEPVGARRAPTRPGAGGDDTAPRRPHLPPRAKNVIYLFMAGAPSQLDLFEPKPALQRHHGQPVPESLTRGQRFAFLKGTPRLLGTSYAFARHGQCGAPVSELMPHLATVVDKVAFVRSMHTDHFNHGPAQVFMNTGSTLIGRPSLGAWTMYGLGSDARDLPGFVVMVSGKIDPGAGSACWSSGFLPTTYQGVELRGRGEPVPCVKNPAGVDAAMRGRSIDLVCDLDEELYAATGDAEIRTRIAAYELAFRMQTSVPELCDLAREPAAVRARYGAEPGRASFANNCLLARRMVERGVRFVQLYHRGWDHHGSDASDDLLHGLPTMCRQTDRAVAALLTDLEQRGLLEETLVVWGGEFGRTPMQEVRDVKFLGRDHHPRSFTIWLAGAGVKPGISIGTTDDLGYDIASDPVHVNDLHATMLHLLGLDHLRLVFRHQGREFRLTDVAGTVVAPLLA